MAVRIKGKSTRLQPACYAAVNSLSLLARFNLLAWKSLVKRCFAFRNGDVVEGGTVSAYIHWKVSTGNGSNKAAPSASRRRKAGRRFLLGAVPLRPRSPRVKRFRCLCLHVDKRRGHSRENSSMCVWDLYNAPKCNQKNVSNGTAGNPAQHHPTGRKVKFLQYICCKSGHLSS